MKKYIKIAALLSAAAILVSFPGCISVKFENGTEETTAAQVRETLPLPTEGVPPTENFTEAQPTESVLPTEYDPLAEEPQTAYSPTPDLAADPIQMTPEEQLAFFNDAVNSVKTSRVGFTKTERTEVGDVRLSNTLANSLISVVKSALLPESAQVQTVEPGDPSDHLMSPTNMPYVSGLDMNDIDSVSVVPLGTDRVITVRVKSERDPDPKGSSSAKIFDFATADDIRNVYAPKAGAVVSAENVSTLLSDCTAKATVDAYGRVISYETVVRETVELKNAMIRVMTTDLTAVIVRTVTYSDMRYSTGLEF